MCSSSYTFSMLELIKLNFEIFNELGPTLFYFVSLEMFLNNITDTCLGNKVSLYRFL